MARRTAREAGLRFGLMATGERNTIADVPGVWVGHSTVVKGHGRLVPGEGPVRTGVTAVLPGPPNWRTHKVKGGIASLNGCGEMTGALYVEEFGFLEAPLLLTNTLAVGAAASGLLKWMVAKGLADGSSESVIPTVAECDDSYLNDIWGAHVGDGEVRLALDSASADFPQGSVGGGTGMSCLGFKGGIGSSSRVARVGGQQHVVGVLVQANFGTQEALTLRGVPVGRLLGAKGVWGQGEGGGSIVTVVATDAPLSSRQLKRLARRTFLGLARVGSTSANGSGDISLAFSTANRVDYFGEVEIVNEVRMGDRYLSPLFQAVVEATEEAVVNALFTAETVVGRDGHVSRELPVEDVLALLEGPPIS